mmetsp:Transcript_7445/g.15932  ORF Transcript_7445/g.15932 Transcript_7445/m.15932 type:complete len:86 (+) Transcript_7445:65-322(+)|eukprot:CAMPEP_0171354114 /NCGR_PEP_ID=MMETSP0878-20121228/44542_1 /TAXON_ID=67004 /ORGANISM="Thalassiosira weissflogii, Strain CCMP1336" /LENGTH=85 /DNA_ID=CAMNT_0011860077 /DNA_START=1116 /DNA_END=1373 /DNA_ORIENTATION=+
MPSRTIAASSEQKATSKNCPNLISEKFYAEMRRGINDACRTHTGRDIVVEAYQIQAETYAYQLTCRGFCHQSIVKVSSSVDMINH